MRASFVFMDLLLTLFLVVLIFSRVAIGEEKGAQGKDPFFGTVTVTAEKAPIMQGKEKVATTNRGETFCVFQVKGDWYAIQYSIMPSKGWIHKDNVTFKPPSCPLGMVYLRINDKGFLEYRNEKDGSVLIRIPAGSFNMGSNLSGWESPVHKVHLDVYFIGKYEVTNEQFARFVSETGYDAGKYWRERARERYPVIYVSWVDAVRYAEWAGLRLPSEAEWESAASGGDGRRWPWGNEIDNNLCNSWEMDRSDLVTSMLHMRFDICKVYRGTLPVGSFPGGASPCGALDMAGNVGEWCSNLYELYPYIRGDGREDINAPGYRVVRGGAWGSYNNGEYRCAKRFDISPDHRVADIGFRVARSF